ncbi:MAG: putative molybdenum carrier protein [Verrucomicrobiota bacterium]
MTLPSALPEIVSGGQTGADRAALDWALRRGVPHGGWCPRGRLAEDGPLAPLYLLRETPSADYAQRTEWNVRDSGGTVIFSLALMLSGGSKTTAEWARHYGRPLLHLARAAGGDPAETLRRFVREHAVARLNEAGPRASHEPAVGAFVARVLEAAFPPSFGGDAAAAKGH